VITTASPPEAPSVDSVLIGGAWRTTAGSVEVLDPARGTVVARVGSAGAAEVREAVAAAAADEAGWGAASGVERCEALEAVAALLGEREDHIARVLATETGKLLGEAVAELRLSAGYFRWFAQEALRLERLTVVTGRAAGDQVVLRKPVGVAALLTPWNFPVSIQARKLAAALAAGTRAVSRPSSEAPVSVVELFRCVQDAGVPDAAANLLTGPADEIAVALLADPRVRAVSFTGSTPVGKRLYSGGAATMKRLALELGGCAPFIVCADADLEPALEHAMLAKFRNCGQSCVAANCFYVHDRHFERFVSGLADRVAALELGDPLAATSTLGPVINAGRRRALEEHIDRATAAGFEHVASCPPLAGPSGLAPEGFLPAAVLAADALEAVPTAIDGTEVFGPVAMVIRFSDLDRLVERVAANPLGLAAYVFSADRMLATAIAAALDVGIAGINEGLATAVNVPMGGVKESGLGREGGHAGMDEFLDLQYLAMRGSLIDPGDVPRARAAAERGG
jgi:succinate-semialdehyde dehydrogenase/glutarate-semialdehyde dehydrogenase